MRQKGPEKRDGDNATAIGPGRIRGSAPYRNALARAATLVKKPEKLEQLVDRASAKINRRTTGLLDDSRTQIQILFRLIRAYARGEYRQVHWSNLVMIVAAIVYFVMPLDLVPDFLLGLGYFDDGAIISWTVKTIADELKKFSRWEEKSRGAPPPTPVGDD